MAFVIRETGVVMDSIEGDMKLMMSGSRTYLEQENVLVWTLFSSSTNVTVTFCSA